MRDGVTAGARSSGAERPAARAAFVEVRRGCAGVGRAAVPGLAAKAGTRRL